MPAPLSLLNELRPTSPRAEPPRASGFADLLTQHMQTSARQASEPMREPAGAPQQRPRAVAQAPTPAAVRPGPQSAAQPAHSTTAQEASHGSTDRSHEAGDNAAPVHPLSPKPKAQAKSQPKSQQSGTDPEKAAKSPTAAASAPADPGQAAPPPVDRALAPEPVRPAVDVLPLIISAELPQAGTQPLEPGLPPQPSPSLQPSAPALAVPEGEAAAQPVTSGHSGTAAPVLPAAQAEASLSGSLRTGELAGPAAPTSGHSTPAPQTLAEAVANPKSALQNTVKPIEAKAPAPEAAATPTQASAAVATARPHAPAHPPVGKAPSAAAAATPTFGGTQATEGTKEPEPSLLGGSRRVEAPQPAVAAVAELPAEAHAAPLAQDTQAAPVPVLGDRGAMPAEPQPTAAAQVPPSPSLTGATLGLSAPRSLQAAPLPSASLPHPPGHPAFAAELGAQVAVWVRDGLHQAQLNLNPADLGPVQVRIQMDGQQAQLQFVADNALTREALQLSVGELTQALKQEGLSLGRSDVQSGQSQARDASGQSTGGQTQAESDGTRPRRSNWGPDEGPPTHASRPAAPAARGLLDLYA